MPLARTRRLEHDGKHKYGSIYKRCVLPGSPSPVGRKPGICQTGQLVTRKGPEGSNPSPGALHEGISERYKADEDSRQLTN